MGIAGKPFHRLRAVGGKPLAGKTGTSNDSRDVWFVGFSPDLACGVFVGFDNPRTLGKLEQGATVAAPVFRDFMKGALDGVPIMTVGKAGGHMRTGLHIAGNGDPISRVGLTLQQIMGIPVQRWGTQSLATAKPIGELFT